MAQQPPVRPSILAQLPVQPDDAAAEDTAQESRPSILANLPVQPTVGGPGDETAPPEGVGAATRASRFLTPLVGSIAGGTVGAALGAPAGPPGMFLGRLGGAAVGAAGGELLQTGFERLFPPTPGADQEARAGLAARTAREMRAGLFGEAGGAVLAPAARLATIGIQKVPGLRRVLAPFRGQLEPYAEEALEQFTTRGPRGNVTHILPGEISESRLLDLAQNVAEAAALGGKKVTAVKAARQEFTTRRVREILDDLGPALFPGQETTITGRVARGRLTAVRNQFKRESDVLWGEWRRLGGDVLAPTPGTDAAVTDLLNLPIGQIKPNTGTQVAQRWAARGGDESLDAATEQVIASMGRRFSPEQMAELAEKSPALRQTLTEVAEMRAAASRVEIPTAEALQELISQLGAIQDEALRGLRSAAPTTAHRQTLRIATIMKNAALEDINAALRASSPEAQVAYEAARDFTRKGSARLRARPVNELMSALEKAPEVVIDQLVTKNNSTQINATRRAIGNRAFRFVQTRALRELADVNPRTGEIAWGDFLQKTTTPGMVNTMTAMFPEGHAQEITRFARLMQQLNINQIGGIGKLAVQFAQSSAVIGVLTGRIDPEVGAIFLTPSVLARVMASQVGLRWLTVGLTARPLSPMAARAASNLLSFILTPEPSAEEPEGVASGTTVRLDPSRLGEITPGQLRTGATVSLGR